MIEAPTKTRILDNPKGQPNKLRRAGEAKRIEILGSLDDRHKRLLGARDRQGLENLAIEYDAMKCPNMANGIRLEAGGL